MADPRERECDKCGKIHRATQSRRPCMGHISGKSPGNADRAGEPCTKGAMRGQDVCSHHGGKSPQNLAAAEKRIAEEQATKVLRRFGEPIDTTPSEALLEAVKWTAGYVAWLRDKVADLDDDEDLVWGATRFKEGGEDRGLTEEAKPNAWLQLLGEWHDRLVRICAEAIKAGIEERRVRIAESQGALVANVIRAILADLDLTPTQQKLVADVVPRHLRAVAS